MNTTQQIIVKSNGHIAGGVVSRNRKAELPIALVESPFSRLREAEDSQHDF